MAKQNNSLTELQALEGIYEHLYTIDDLAKEVGAISTRLRKIEERLKEPVDITDPILAQDLTRDTCIYRALAKSMEACREVKEQKIKQNNITSELKQVKSMLDEIKGKQAKQEGIIDVILKGQDKIQGYIPKYFKKSICILCLIVIMLVIINVI